MTASTASYEADYFVTDDENLTVDAKRILHGMKVIGFSEFQQIVEKF